MLKGDEITCEKRRISKLGSLGGINEREGEKGETVANCVSGGDAYPDPSFCCVRADPHCPATEAEPHAIRPSTEPINWLAIRPFIGFQNEIPKRKQTGFQDQKRQDTLSFQSIELLLG